MFLYGLFLYGFFFELELILHSPCCWGLGQLAADPCYLSRVGQHAVCLVWIGLSAHESEALAIRDIPLTGSMSSWAISDPVLHLDPLLRYSCAKWQDRLTPSQVTWYRCSLLTVSSVCCWLAQLRRMVLVCQVGCCRWFWFSLRVLFGGWSSNGLLRPLWPRICALHIWRPH